MENVLLARARALTKGPSSPANHQYASLEAWIMSGIGSGADNACDLLSTVAPTWIRTLGTAGSEMLFASSRSSHLTLKQMAAVNINIGEAGRRALSKRLADGRLTIDDEKFQVGTSARRPIEFKTPFLDQIEIWSGLRLRDIQLESHAMGIPTHGCVTLVTLPDIGGAKREAPSNGAANFWLWLNDVTRQLGLFDTPTAHEYRITAIEADRMIREKFLYETGLTAISTGGRLSQAQVIGLEHYFETAFPLSVQEVRLILEGCGEKEVQFGRAATSGPREGRRSRPLTRAGAPTAEPVEFEPPDTGSAAVRVAGADLKGLGNF